jgi:hypothetical protein
MPISRAAAEIEPVSRMLSSSLALPGPIRAPESKTMLTLSLAMPATLTRAGFRGTSFPNARPARCREIKTSEKGEVTLC